MSDKDGTCQGDFKFILVSLRLHPQPTFVLIETSGL